MRSAAAITGGDSCLLTKTCAPGRAVRSDDGADSAGGCNALASRLPLQGPHVDPNLLLVARDSPLRTATTAPDSPARDDDTPLLPLRYAIRLDGGEHSCYLFETCDVRDTHDHYITFNMARNDTRPACTSTA